MLHLMLPHFECLTMQKNATLKHTIYKMFNILSNISQVPNLKKKKKVELLIWQT